MIKPIIISDNNKKSLKIKSILIKKLTKNKVSNPKIIIVIGGDGFMLQTLKRLYKLKKPFYGINSGNYGFLMNKFSNNNFIKNLKTSHGIQIHPLQMIVKTKGGQIKKSIAINEVSI